MSAVLKDYQMPEIGSDPELEELESRVQSRLFGRVKDLRLRRQGDGLVIQGRTTSYYAKQLAQHAVMTSTDYPIYGNEITVD